MRSMLRAESGGALKRTRIQLDPAADASALSSSAFTALTDPARFLNRDFEWLEFNRRVLDMANDSGTPLLERIRFLSIFSSNLDEFFMKRVGSLRDQIEQGRVGPVVESLTPAQQFAGIRERVVAMAKSQANTLKNELLPALREKQIDLLKWDGLNIDEQNEARAWFRHNVFPILTPLAVDPGHRFPFISNMSVSLGVMLQRPGESEQLFARVKVPEIPSRLYCVPGTRRWIPLQDIIQHNLDELFPGMEILKVLPFRVTRNAEIDNDNDDADDLLEAIQQQLRERRFARVVRMEIPSDANPRILKFLMDELEIDEADIYETDGLLEYGALNEIADLDDATLHFSPWTPLKPPQVGHGNYDIFARIRKGDVLLHHPYESFEASIQKCFASSKVCTAQVAIVHLSPASFRPPKVESKLRCWLNCARALTRRAIFVGRESWRTRACTWPTAWLDSRPTPRPRWLCAKRPTAFVATDTSARVITIPRPRGCTRTLVC